ncbi:MAG TPA: hypothetical protein VFI47_24400 [Acidimicrobiales bacterium]|nr:hypothetical protein [Acidimicrobiales bacterium]
MIPAPFRGAWRRVSLSVDGGPPIEPSDVVWVQSASAYADLRVPRPGHADRHPPASFAGITTWRDPHLHWRHDVDLDVDPISAGGAAPAGGDVGRVWWDGADLVETGTFGTGDRGTPYVEVWRRLPGSGGPTDDWASPDGTRRFVQAGDHAITVADGRAAGGRYRACYRRRRAGAWTVELALGDGAADLPLIPHPIEETTRS